MELKESTYVISAKTEHTMGEKRIGWTKTTSMLVLWLSILTNGSETIWIISFFQH